MPRAATRQRSIQQGDQGGGVLEGRHLPGPVQARMRGRLHPDAEQDHVAGPGVDEDAVGVQELMAHAAPASGLHPGRRLADDRAGGLGMQRPRGQQSGERRSGWERVLDDGGRAVRGTGGGPARGGVPRIIEHDDVLHLEQVRVLHQVGAPYGVGGLQCRHAPHHEQDHVLAGGDRARTVPYGTVGDAGQGDASLQRPPGAQCVRLWVRVHGPSFSSSDGGAPVACIVHATRSPPSTGG